MKLRKIEIGVCVLTALFSTSAMAFDWKNLANDTMNAVAEAAKKVESDLSNAAQGNEGASENETVDVASKAPAEDVTSNATPSSSTSGKSFYDVDILGIRIGDSEVSALNTLKNRRPNLQVKPYDNIYRYDNGEDKLRLENSGVYGWESKKEIVFATLAMPPSKPEVVSVIRSHNYSDGPAPKSADFEAALFDKYGLPSIVLTYLDNYSNTKRYVWLYEESGSLVPSKIPFETLRAGNKEMQFKHYDQIGRGCRTTVMIGAEAHPNETAQLRAQKGFLPKCKYRKALGVGYTLKSQAGAVGEYIGAYSMTLVDMKKFEDDYKAREAYVEKEKERLFLEKQQGGTVDF